MRPYTKQLREEPKPPIASKSQVASRNQKIKGTKSQKQSQSRNVDDEMVDQMIKIQNLHYGLRQNETNHLQSRSRESLKDYTGRRSNSRGNMNLRTNSRREKSKRSRQ